MDPAVLSLGAAADLATVAEAASSPGVAADLAIVDAVVVLSVDVVVLLPADVEEEARGAAEAKGGPKQRNRKLETMRTCRCPLRN